MPTRPPRAIWTLLMVALAGAPFRAQSNAGPGRFTLYRCGPQGLELRNTPCPQDRGASQVLRYEPDDAQAAASARERARQEGRLAERLQREREARAEAEREALRQAPAGVSIKPSAAPLAELSTPASTPAQRTVKTPRNKPTRKPPRPDRPHARSGRE